MMTKFLQIDSCLQLHRRFFVQRLHALQLSSDAMSTNKIEDKDEDDLSRDVEEILENESLIDD